MVVIYAPVEDKDKCKFYQQLHMYFATYVRGTFILRRDLNGCVHGISHCQGAVERDVVDCDLVTFLSKIEASDVFGNLLFEQLWMYSIESQEYYSRLDWQCTNQPGMVLHAKVDYSIFLCIMCLRVCVWV